MFGERFTMVPLNVPSTSPGKDMGYEVASIKSALARGFRGAELAKRIEEAKLEAEEERRER